MALPRELTLEDDIAAFNAPYPEEPSVALPEADAYARWRASAERHSMQIDRLAQSLKVLEKNGERVFDTVKGELEAGTLSISLDELIEHYADIEREFRESYLPELRQGHAYLRQQFSLPAPKEDRSWAISSWEKHVRVYTRILEFARDFHWKLKGLRSLQEARKSPIFNTSRELADYLDEL
jgi:hypothetical protein